MKRCAFLTGLFFLLVFPFGGRSQTNNWTSLVTGNWHDVSSWSLGLLPGSNQWVNVTNSGSKAVFVNAVTRDSFPKSMTVSNLVLLAPLGWTNTILLNFIGTTVPFTDLKTCYVGTNSVFLNQFSGFTVGMTNDGLLNIEGGIVGQEGGSNIVNGTCQVGTDFGFGQCTLTNGVFKSGKLNIGSDGGGHYTQIGGQTLADNISIVSHVHDASFSLSNGVVRTESITVRDGSFTQINSDVFAGSVVLSSLAGVTTYSMVGGSLTNVFASIGEGTTASMTQSGGIFAGQYIDVSGDTYSAHPSFTMNGGQLFADEITRNVGGTISQNGGIISVRRQVFGGIQQSGGLLMSSNIFINDYFPLNLTQSGGTNITTNLFAIQGDGHRFTLQGGSLAISNLMLLFGGEFSHLGGTLTNNGSVIFNGGHLLPALPNEFFARIDVEDDSSLIFPSSNCVVHFVNSVAVQWNDTAVLEIFSWNGSTNGGGTHQLIVGTNGLTTTQLEQIAFVNPAGLPVGSYNAKLLNSGELVPTTTVSLVLRTTPSGFTLLWPDPDAELLSSTNVAGPYLPVAGAASPYAVSFSESQRFFLLQKP